MAEPTHVAEGTDGTIRVYTDHVEIVDHRILESLRSGEKTEMIPFDQLASVKYRSPGRVRNGIIKLLPENVDDKDIHSNSEPYAVRFFGSDESDFEQVRDHVKESY